LSAEEFCWIVNVVKFVVDADETERAANNVAAVDLRAQTNQH